MLELKDVRYQAPSGWRLAIDELSIEAGQAVAVVGHNGVGKSTLLRLMAHLLQPRSGEVRYLDEPVTSRATEHRLRQEVVMVHQNPYLLDMSVAENIAYGLRLRKVPQAEARARVETVLDELGLAGFGGRHAHALSGGETQRVAIARALVLRPRLLLLDEPTSATDAESAERIVDQVARRDWCENPSVVVTTHSLDRLPGLFDRQLRLADGKLLHEAVNAPAQATIRRERPALEEGWREGTVIEIRLETDTVRLGFADGAEAYVARAEYDGMDVRVGEKVLMRKLEVVE